MPLAVIIVSFESAQILPRCVASAMQQITPDDEVILWDNGSGPATQQCLDRLQTQWPALIIHRSTENLGFAGGNNAAAMLAKAHDLFLLNPDAILQPGAMQAMRQALQDDETVATVGAVQLSLDQRTIDGLGDTYHVSGLPWRTAYGRSAIRLEQLIGICNEPTSEIFSACGAAQLARRSAWNAAAGFDDDYFCYCEDVDLGFRLRLAGWRNVRANAAQVLHAGSMSTGRDSDFSVYHGHRNLVWTFAKNIPLGLLILVLTPHLLMNVAIIIYYSLRGRGRVILRAKRDAISGLPTTLSKRRQIQSDRRITSWQVWKLLNKSLWRTGNA